MRRTFLQGAAALGAVAMLAGGPALAQTQWDMPTEQSQTSLTGIADQFFADAVKEKTGGAIDITVHYGGALGYKGKDHYDAVGTGALVLADSYTGPFVGFDPIWQISALPFLTSSIKDAWTLYQASKPAYEAALAKNNQVLLYTIPWTPSGIWARKAVTGVDDLKGLKIRTYDPLGLMTLEGAGAQPITLSFGDVVPQLTTGGIDAVLTSAEGGFRNKFADLLSHFVEITYAAPLSVVHMNKDVWDGLPDAQKQAIRDAAEATEQMIWERVVARDQENYKGMREAGVTVIEDPSPEMLDALQAAAQPAIEQWKEKAGAAGVEALDAYAKARGK